MSYNTDREEFLKLKRAAFDTLYASLNEMQRKSVYRVNGELLILAGAGTGKTTVLVNRIAHIITYGDAYYHDAVPSTLTEEQFETLKKYETLDKEQLREALKCCAYRPCPPWGVLAITFTNKAANEMKQRLAALVGEGVADQMWVGTFHSVCVRILRSNVHLLGDRFNSGFTIYDGDDSKRLIVQCMRELNIDEKMLPAKSVAARISRIKDELTTPEEFNEATNNGDFRESSIATIYELYQHRLGENNALDFDDLIFKTVYLLRTHPEVLENYRRKFSYVNVDEYQDTNPAQFELTKLLSSGKHNLMVVGDDDQSIYKFRGATIKNILQFDTVFKNCEIIKLEENYRSTSNILGAANSVIRHNFGRRGKELWTEKKGGAGVHIRKLNNQNDEARFIINTVRDFVNNEGRKFSECAVLYRMNAQSNSLENQFARSGIPYRVLGGTRFYERREIKDILAYLTVINNPSDNLRLKRIVNEPKRKIGDSTMTAVEDIAAETGTSLFTVMANASSFTALAKNAPKLEKFAAMILSLKECAETKGMKELCTRLLDETGYREMLLSSTQPEDIDRLANIEELVTNMVQYEESNDEPTLDGFLQSVSLVADIDNYDKSADAVVLMTIHSAKGLEFPIVFLPGMEEGIFPGIMSVNNPDELEEERRLAYVAMTRAKEHLYMLHTDERMFFGKTQRNPPSMFLGEISEEFIDAEPIKKAPTAQPKQEIRPTTKRKHPLSAEVTRPSSEIGSVGKTTGFERFAPGDRVRHMTFGEGNVLTVTEMGADILYEIVFDRVGTKKLMATYAKLRRA